MKRVQSKGEIYSQVIRTINSEYLSRISKAACHNCHGKIWLVTPHSQWELYV